MLLHQGLQSSLRHVPTRKEMQVWTLNTDKERQKAFFPPILVRSATVVRVRVGGGLVAHAMGHRLHAAGEG